MVMGGIDHEGRLKDCYMPRRRLLNWFLGTSGASLVVATLYPIIKYLIPPKIHESSAQSVTLPVKAQEMGVNSGQIFRFGNQPGILIRTPSGELRAFTAICTHLACVVQYRPDIQHIWCACHNGHFDLIGRNVGGPPPRPLQPYIVDVKGQQIVVSKST